MNQFLEMPDGHKLVQSFLTFDQWIFMIILPVIIVFIITFFVGLERQNVGKAAGISAHVLVGISALMVAVMQRILFYNQIELGITDAEGQRVIAQVVTGIGFIGAGVIMKDSGGTIHGLTTAATIWFCAMLGLLLGSGFLYEGTFFGIIVVLFIIIRDFKRGLNPFKPTVEVREKYKQLKTNTQ